MKRASPAALAVATALLALPLVPLVVGLGHGQPAADTRQRLALPPAARDKVLAEMRVMLESVHAILRGVVAGDPAAVEKAARAAGLGMAVDMDPEVVRQLPPAFRALGMQTHRAFDDLADRMKAGGTGDDAVRALAALTGHCVACHAVYRLDEAR